MVARITSADVYGIDGRVVDIEVDYVNNPVPNFVISGLPGKGIRESRERIRSAVWNSGLQFPTGRLMVNLAPAAWEKRGAVFDLPIAIAILLAAKQIPRCHPGSSAGASRAEPERTPDRVPPAAGSRRPTESPATETAIAAIGELSLDGEVRPVHGVLGLVEALRRAGVRSVLVPERNVEEAAAVPGIHALGVRTLRHAIGVLGGGESAVVAQGMPPLRSPVVSGDFSDVVGHDATKRALIVAVAGEHNVLFVGPPGAGKSFMARRVPALLPPPTREEVLEITRIQSAAAFERDAGLVVERPFRAPHHTVSWAGLVGGGTIPRPGEITAAHRGVLFLDELPEFPRQSLEALREPLEEGWITISRSQATLRFPAQFLLIAAMNPCPCGYFMQTSGRCRCPVDRVRRYLERVSGPLLDRIDLRLEIQSVASGELLSPGSPAAASRSSPLSTESMRAEIERARAFRDGHGRRRPNRTLDWSAREVWAPLEPAARRLVLDAAKGQQLSTRGLTRVLRLARTVADLDESVRLAERHILEALTLRANGRVARALEHG